MPGKKLSSAEKKKRGTKRKDELHQLKKHDVHDYPRPVVALTRKAEKEAYIRLCDHLREAGNLYDVDSVIISLAAVAIGQLDSITKEWRRAGSIQVFPNETRNISPELTAYEKVSNILLKYAEHLGLSVKTRQDLIAFLEVSGEEEDALGSLMQPPSR